MIRNVSSIVPVLFFWTILLIVQKEMVSILSNHPRPKRCRIKRNPLRLMIIWIRTSSAQRGIFLVTQPSDDPGDPLNWPLSKKIIILTIVTLTAWVGIAQALANQGGYVVQARLYNRTAVEISYSASPFECFPVGLILDPLIGFSFLSIQNCAAIVALAVGPLLIWNRIGRTPCIFQRLLGTFACRIWSACMTSPNSYVPSVISRWLGGTFGSCRTTIGGGFILDMFFLHQRGKSFAFFTVAMSLGFENGATFSGFIANSTTWPLQF